MALSVATNSAALMAQAAASSVNKTLETSMERLSSGLRINSAADDAAGVAIAARLTSEIRGANQAIRNAMDGQAMIDTAEGAHKEVVNLLQRMRELAIQAANDTNSTVDRGSLNNEFNQLSDEITRIGATASWAGVSLVAADGTFSIHVGSGNGTGSSIDVDFKKVAAGSLGSGGTNVDALNVDTQSNATAAIATIDTAIAGVNTQRATLGSISNRLDNTVANLTNASTNLQAGLGRIQDADFAAETTTLAKSQILQQASTAMLAQANAAKQNVLSLLQG